ncbi:MAG: DNRLRE domain-containing protein, partial [Candidatus Bathyarchaeota archaeon]|nr:DNRLRE domain-containing protein [Candidatus Bathyarchaeota archaeon]
MSSKDLYRLTEKTGHMRSLGFAVLILAFATLSLSSSFLQPCATSFAGTGQTSKTITLQAIADAYVDDSNSTFNFGELNTLRVESWNLPSAKRNAYIMFDLSSIPADATVNHAELQVFCWYTWSETSSISVHQVLDDSWREDEITWGNAPPYFFGATDIVVVSYDDIDKEPRYISWNVTTDLQTFILMGKKELTEVLTVWDPKYEVEFTLFESREGENPPRLVVDYTSSGEITTTKTPSTQTTPEITAPGYTILAHKIAKIEGDTTTPTNRFLPTDKAVYLYFEIDWRSVEDCEKTRFTQKLYDPGGLMSEKSLSFYIEILGAGQAMRSGSLLLFNITDASKVGTWRVEWYEGDKLLFTEKFDIASTAPPMT